MSEKTKEAGNLRPTGIGRNMLKRRLRENLTERLREAAKPNIAMYHTTWLADVADALERLQKPWVSVNDSLPTLDDGFILAACDDGEVVLWSARKLVNGKDYVTHWMPVPDPPENHGDL